LDTTMYPIKVIEFIALDVDNIYFMIFFAELILFLDRYNFVYFPIVSIDEFVQFFVRSYYFFG
jgi:hypothetical protein